MIQGLVSKAFIVQMDQRVHRKLYAQLEDTVHKVVQHQNCAQEGHSVIRHSYGKKINAPIALLALIVWKMDLQVQVGYADKGITVQLDQKLIIHLIVLLDCIVLQVIPVFIFIFYLHFVSLHYVLHCTTINSSLLHYITHYIAHYITHYVAHYITH